MHEQAELPVLDIDVHQIFVLSRPGHKSCVTPVVRSRHEVHVFASLPSHRLHIEQVMKFDRSNVGVI